MLRGFSRGFWSAPSNGNAPPLGSVGAASAEAPDRRQRLPPEEEEEGALGLRMLTLQVLDYVKGAFIARLSPRLLLFPGNISLGPHMLESTSGQRRLRNELQLFLVEHVGPSAATSTH